ncbi:MAG: hypothetical protein IKO64_04540 [Kiritimatiellae bacterium]|nr:hypothetical protein [Kiritimatiellia bacterium]
MKRDASIELYRVAMILGVCFLHSITFGKLSPTPIYDSVCMFCVVGFVLITGWFGCRLHVRKIIDLYAIGLWCAALSVVLRLFADGAVLNHGFLSEVRSQLWRYWFLHAYVFVMLISPFVNASFGKEGGWRPALPLIFIAFAWSWISGLCPDVLPQVPGLANGGYSGFVLAAVYATGRAMRQLDSQGRRLSGIWAVFIFVLCIVAVCLMPNAIGKSSRAFAAYNSPVVLIMAIASFYAFRQIPVGSVLARWLLFVTPSVFPIYLLQTNAYAIPKIHSLAVTLDGWGMPRFLVYLATALAIFTACLGCDFGRRLLLLAVSRSSMRSNAPRRRPRKPESTTSSAVWPWMRQAVGKWREVAVRLGIPRHEQEEMARCFARL